MDYSALCQGPRGLMFADLELDGEHELAGNSRNQSEVNEEWLGHSIGNRFSLVQFFDTFGGSLCGRRSHPLFHLRGLP